MTATLPSLCFGGGHEVTAVALTAQTSLYPQRTNPQPTPAGPGQNATNNGPIRAAQENGKRTIAVGRHMLVIVLAQPILDDLLILKGRRKFNLYLVASQFVYCASF